MTNGRQTTLEGYEELGSTGGEANLHKGEAGITLLVSGGEMMVYRHWDNVLLHKRPLLEGEWDELWAFLRRGEVTA